LYCDDLFAVHDAASPGANARAWNGLPPDIQAIIASANLVAMISADC
jgi:hypothetical protein